MTQDRQHQMGEYEKCAVCGKRAAVHYHDRIPWQFNGLYMEYAAGDWHHFCEQHDPNRVIELRTTT